MKKNILVLILASGLIFTTSKIFERSIKNESRVSYGAAGIGAPKGLQGRAAWEWHRLMDPETGTIPPNIRQRELAYANKHFPASLQGEKAAAWEARGPFNVGGRTRALVMDVRDENTMWAGAVSGGIWRTTDGGQSWNRLPSNPDQLLNVTTIAQDPRAGEEDTWYYGTGEALGNSPSGPGAFYLGNGIYKTTDNGTTWQSLDSTASNTAESFDSFWDLVFRLAVDPTDNVNDVVMAAALGTIARSEDGGENWEVVLGGSAGSSTQATDIVVTSSGDYYATLSSNSVDKGIWRSEDGVNWVNITDTAFPSVYNRLVIGLNPSDENELYFLGNTPGSGQTSTTFLDEEEDNSLWKYTYISGDGTGSGGSWVNLSSGIPNNNASNFDNFYAQGSYNMMVRVKPDDPNTVFIGGTNLFRSTDGFTSQNNTTQIGGYMPGTQFPNFQIYQDHHPDLHDVIFLPSDPDVMISASDGGVHRTNDVNAPAVSWISLNNGYQSTQLYTIGFNPSTSDDVLIGGFQDNGNFFTSSNNPQANWVLPLNGDGSFMGIANSGNLYYLSIQRGKIFKMDIDASGSVNAFRRIDPIGGADYNFINPLVLDPNDNNIMYVAGGRRVWRNDDLGNIPLTNEYDSITQGWSSFSDLLSQNSSVSAISVSTVPPNIVYYGTASGGLFKIEDAHNSDPQHQNIRSSGSPRNGGFPGGTINSIAIDPTDADRVLIAFSNYNVYSLYFTENGGDDWERVGGNLEADTVGGGPGPSCRWVSILPLSDGKLYLVGTSVGLFGAESLSRNTNWEPILTDQIGNVVVEMVQTRPTDGLIAVATHGNGIYTTRVKNVKDVVGIDDIGGDQPGSLNIYPNPSNGNFFTTTPFANVPYTVTVRGLNGSIVYNSESVSKSRLIQVSLEDVSDGVYLISIQQQDQVYSEKVLLIR